MKDRYEFVVDLIKEAGELILKSSDKNIDVSYKNNDERDFVTNVDTEVNNFLTYKIKADFPEDHIYSEEINDTTVAASYWSLDPIDGTSNFARGIPHFATVISYLEDGEPVVGAIYNPVTKELFSFDRDKGAFLNGKKISVSQVASLKDAYVLLHIGRKEEVREWGINLQKTFLRSAKKNINLGSSALDLAFLAAGRVDAVIYGTMTTRDIAVATSLVRAAGGEVYSLDGSPVKFLSTSQQIIGTCTGSLFEKISKV